MAIHDPFLIYGATGYTGHLLARAAVARGLRPVLAGRDPARLAAIGQELGLPHRVAGLDLSGALDGIDVVVHAAGPYRSTFEPVVEACLRSGAHYLDLTGEVATIEAVARRDADARRRGVMLMPSVGFDAVA